MSSPGADRFTAALRGSKGGAVRGGTDRFSAALMGGAGSKMGRSIQGLERDLGVEQEGTMLERATSAVLTNPFVSSVLDVISRPNFAIAGVYEEIAAGHGMLSAGQRLGRELFSGVGGIQGEKQGFGQVFEDLGYGAGGSMSGLLPSMFSETGDEWFKYTRGGFWDWTARGSLGLALDIVADPLTYVTAGYGAIGRRAVKAGTHYLSKTGENALKRSFARNVKRGLGQGEADRLARKFVANEIDKGAKHFADKGGVKIFGQTIIPGEVINTPARNVRDGVVKFLHKSTLGEGVLAIGEGVGTVFNRDFPVRKIPEYVARKQLYYTELDAAQRQMREFVQDLHRTTDEVGSISKKDREAISMFIESRGKAPLDPRLVPVAEANQKAYAKMAALETEAGLLDNVALDYIYHAYNKAPHRVQHLISRWDPSRARATLQGSQLRRGIPRFDDETLAYLAENGVKPILDSADLLMRRGLRHIHAMETKKFFDDVAKRWGKRALPDQMEVGGAALSKELNAVREAVARDVAAAPAKAGGRAAAAPLTYGKAVAIPLDEFNKRMRPQPGVLTDEGKFVVGSDHGNALVRAEEMGLHVSPDELGQRAGWRAGKTDDFILDIDLPEGTPEVLQFAFIRKAIREGKPVPPERFDEFRKAFGAAGEPDFLADIDTLEAAARDMAAKARGARPKVARGTKLSTVRGLSDEGKRHFLAERFDAVHHPLEMENVLNKYREFEKFFPETTNQNIRKLKSHVGEDMATLDLREFKGLTMPVDIALDIRDLGKPLIDTKTAWGRAATDMLHAYDKFMNTFKLGVTSIWPAFHFRNAYSNIVQQFTDLGIQALHPKMHMDTVRMLANDVSGSFASRIGRQWSYSEVVFEAKRRGVLADYRNIFETFGDKVPIRTGKGAADYIRHPFDSMKQLGGLVENEARLSAFSNYLRRGLDAETAAARVNKVLFDYKNLSTIEREVLARMFPFYRWTRKNIQLQAERLVRNPQQAATQTKLTRQNRTDKKLLPSYLRGDFVFTLEADEKTGELTYIRGLDLPITDLNVLGEPFSRILSDATPAAKMLIELSSDHDLFRHRKISEVSTPLVKQIGMALDFLPQRAKKAIEFSKRETKDGTEYRVNPVLAHVAIKSWALSRAYGTAERLLRAKSLYSLENARDITTGFRLGDVDVDTKERGLLREYEDHLESRAAARGIRKKFEITYTPKE